MTRARTPCPDCGGRRVDRLPSGLFRRACCQRCDGAATEIRHRTVDGERPNRKQTVIEARIYQDAHRWALEYEARPQSRKAIAELCNDSPLTAALVVSLLPPRWRRDLLVGMTARIEV